MSIADALNALITELGGKPSGSRDIATCIQECAEAVKAKKAADAKGAK